MKSSAFSLHVVTDGSILNVFPVPGGAVFYEDVFLIIAMRQLRLYRSHLMRFIMFSVASTRPCQ